MEAIHRDNALNCGQGVDAGIDISLMKYVVTAALSHESPFSRSIPFPTPPIESAGPAPKNSSTNALP